MITKTVKYNQRLYEDKVNVSVFAGGIAKLWQKQKRKHQ
jgi:hypothetical protein